MGDAIRLVVELVVDDLLDKTVSDIVEAVSEVVRSGRGRGNGGRHSVFGRVGASDQFTGFDRCLTISMLAS